MLPFLQTACNCKIIKASVLLTFIKGRGIDTLRLVSIRGAQKLSSMCT